MNQAKEISGTRVGMGLSGISCLHLLQNGFHSDKNYFIRVTGNQVLLYRGSVKRPRRQEIHENSISNLSNRNKSSGISANVRRKIMKTIDAWFTTIDYANTSGHADKMNIKKHLALITLTLPFEQFHDDKYLKRHALMMFVKELKKHSQTVQYLWKAEPQKNGNIHFHIVIDEYIPKEKITSWWNSRMTILGYTQAYMNKTGKDNPPSTNIESLRDKNSSGAYVAKYFSKEDNTRVIEGRCWGCSDTIRNLDTAEISVQHDELDEWLSVINTNTAKAYVTDFCAIFKHCQGTEFLINKALSNYHFENILLRNVHTLYCHRYELFKGQLLTGWEQDIIKETSHLEALYLFENDMIGW